MEQTPELIKELLTYYDSIKGYLFVTSITIGAFLFTMKSFIVLNMKKEVYDTNAYIEHYVSSKKLGVKETRYAPLERLRQFLYLSIFSALVNGPIQLFLGYFSNAFVLFLSLVITLITWGLVLYSLYLVNQNLKWLTEFSDVTEN